MDGNTVSVWGSVTPFLLSVPFIVSGEADATLPVSSLEALPELHVARRKATGRSRPKMI
jgi:hypothetical protein